MVQRSIHRFNWRKSHKILSEEDRQTAEHREEDQDQNLLQDISIEGLRIYKGQSADTKQIQRRL